VRSCGTLCRSVVGKCDFKMKDFFEIVILSICAKQPLLTSDVP
jgi:hypothetical protein